MQLLKFAIFVVTAMLSSSAIACKCEADIKTPPADDECPRLVTFTEKCCSELGGTMNGDDCVAHSIAEKLKAFHKCCQGKSDCNYPGPR
ncbi:uncharacterized protein GIQ15_01637 [Arthroderma uncinatum]|uniref:uncharacterized protein n=1 Tax=Arthroderma uncinatum TaxID=74035 RepID=UPI00144A6D70|nr:uncharacterized protein GIQ15_01637 [Arthroderma uncinatum]KAF3492120.1 hypothetical protein GIQ15_01637 [Arthroderma uncinatum]